MRSPFFPVNQSQCQHTEHSSEGGVSRQVLFLWKGGLQWFFLSSGFHTEPCLGGLSIPFQDLYSLNFFSALIWMRRVKLILDYTSLVMMMLTYTSNKFLPKPNPVWKPDDRKNHWRPPFHKKRTCLLTPPSLLCSVCWHWDWLTGKKGLLINQTYLRVVEMW